MEWNWFNTSFQIPKIPTCFRYKRGKVWLLADPESPLIVICGQNYLHQIYYLQETFSATRSTFQFEILKLPSLTSPSLTGLKIFFTKIRVLEFIEYLFYLFSKFRHISQIGWGGWLLENPVYIHIQKLADTYSFFQQNVNHDYNKRQLHLWRNYKSFVMSWLMLQCLRPVVYAYTKYIGKKWRCFPSF